MTDILIILAAAGLLAGLLVFENKENTIGKLVTKTPLSILFLVAVLVQNHPDQWYFHFLFMGLFFCLCGDVFLALPSERMFLFGLVSFLLGHVFYVIGFIYLVHFGPLLSLGTAIIFGASALVFLYFRPHLGEMTVPVLVYVAVISIMLSGALAVLGVSTYAKAGRIMVFVGALLFYLSDLFVARDRFVKKEPINRYLGLPMYYGGQFLLAFSVGLLV
jgi:uncharacterized membrane protein YhhN